MNILCHERDAGEADGTLAPPSFDIEKQTLFVIDRYRIVTSKTGDAQVGKFS